MKKDYWDICKRNCIAIAVLSVLLLLFLLLLPIKPLIPLVMVVVDIIIWIVLGRMFSKRSPKP